MFSKRLRKLRKEKKITQIELANTVNLTQSTIASYENGYKLPTLDTLCYLARFFDVSCDYLLGMSEKRNDRNSSLLEDNFSDDELRILKYYDRLTIENKDYVAGIMVQCLKEQDKQKSTVRDIG